MGTAFKILPKNYLEDWGEFESFSGGEASAPDGWISASSFLGGQEGTSIKFGSYSVRVIGNGALGGLYRTIPDGDDYKGRTFKFGVWGKSSSTGPYFELNDGVASKTVHLDGSNAFVFLTTPPMKLNYNSTQLRVNLFASVGSTAYFDGAVLCEGEDLFTNLTGNIDISQWSPTLTMKQDQFEIAHREGSYVPDVHLQARTIRVAGSVVGSDVISTRNHFDTLMKSLLAWQTAEKRNVYLYDDRVLETFLKSFDWDYKNGLQMIRFNVALVSPDSTTRSIGKYRKSVAVTGTNTEFSISYNGTAKSKPIISFIANQGNTITQCSLENLTSGELTAYTGTVPQNITLDIDCENATVKNSSIDNISNFSGDFLGIIRGTNNFRFTGSNCQINIDYFERYL